MKKRAVVLGSTGSIGRSTLDVLAGMADEWEVVGLAAGSQGAALAEQANHFRPAMVALAARAGVGELEGALAYTPRVLFGSAGLVQLVEDLECDCLVSAIVGMEGLAATVRAVELGRRIALANKE
ncbi:MAG: 1-deoxy-D-xylulose-5-phosphate reductoisomerase, partial [Planctomycetes bacterium]|nr:1-deoxy-D-xylulose-5-phosphate reductoisomerase [Planctomycetota bacterium]